MILITISMTCADVYLINLYFEECSVELPLFALHRWYINLFVNN